jgi:hypothetical protein
LPPCKKLLAIRLAAHGLEPMARIFCLLQARGKGKLGRKQFARAKKAACLWANGFWGGMEARPRKLPMQQACFFRALRINP